MARSRRSICPTPHHLERAHHLYLIAHTAVHHKNSAGVKLVWHGEHGRALCVLHVRPTARTLYTAGSAGYEVRARAFKAIPVTWVHGHPPYHHRHTRPSTARAPKAHAPSTRDMPGHPPCPPTPCPLGRPQRRVGGRLQRCLIRQPRLRPARCCCCCLLQSRLDRIAATAVAGSSTTRASCPQTP